MEDDGDVFSSLDSSPACTVASASDVSADSERGAEVDYGYDSFEDESGVGEGLEPQLGIVAGVETVQDTGDDEEEYGSDEFEADEQEDVESEGRADLTDTDGVQEGPAVACSSVAGSDSYGSESFEEEEEEVGHPHVTESGKESYEVQESSGTASADKAVTFSSLQSSVDPPSIPEDNSPQFGSWCSEKRAALLASPSRTPDKRNGRAASTKYLELQDRVIPAGVVASLMARSMVPRARVQLVTSKQESGGWSSHRQQLKVPSTLLQRAQTQRWLASCAPEHTGIPLSERRLSTRPQSKSTMSTFASVKQDKLRGELATKQAPAALTRWSSPLGSGGMSLATLEHMCMLITAQRQMQMTAIRVEQRAQQRLHTRQVATHARLQLEASRALRARASASRERDPGGTPSSS